MKMTVNKEKHNIEVSLDNITQGQVVKYNGLFWIVTDNHDLVSLDDGEIIKPYFTDIVELVKEAHVIIEEY